MQGTGLRRGTRSRGDRRARFRRSRNASPALRPPRCTNHSRRRRPDGAAVQGPDASRACAADSPTFCLPSGTTGTTLYLWHRPSCRASVLTALDSCMPAPFVTACEWAAHRPPSSIHATGGVRKWGGPGSRGSVTAPEKRFARIPVRHHCHSASTCADSIEDSSVPRAGTSRAGSVRCFFTSRSTGLDCTGAVKRSDVELRTQHRPRSR